MYEMALSNALVALEDSFNAIVAQEDSFEVSSFRVIII